MNVAYAFTAIVCLGIAGAAIAACIVYRERAKTSRLQRDNATRSVTNQHKDLVAARTEIACLRGQNTILRNQLHGARQWDRELSEARAEAARLLSPDADPLEQMFAAPAVVPEHERGSAE